jgi:hypothetical protein
MKWSGIEGDYTILTLSLLGSSLEEIFASNNRKFNLTTVLVIADQLVSIGLSMVSSSMVELESTDLLY